MEAIELCIHGELFFFENTITPKQGDMLENYMCEYFKTKRDICINDFVVEVENQLQISLKFIKIVKVIAT